jgi:hypothetical protein
MVIFALHHSAQWQRYSNWEGTSSYKNILHLMASASVCISAATEINWGRFSAKPLNQKLDALDDRPIRSQPCLDISQERRRMQPDLTTTQEDLYYVTADDSQMNHPPGCHRFPLRDKSAI